MSKYNTRNDDSDTRKLPQNGYNTPKEGGADSVLSKLDDIVKIADRAPRSTAPEAGTSTAGLSSERGKSAPNKSDNVVKVSDRLPMATKHRPLPPISRSIASKHDEKLEKSFTEALDGLISDDISKSGNSDPAHRPGGRQASVPTGETSKFASDAEKSLYALLAQLKTDIENLRAESDAARQHSFVPAPELSQPDKELPLYAMLSELKSDIVALKQESDRAVRPATGSRTVAARGGEAELFAMLSDLRSDITTLKAESHVAMIRGGGGSSGIQAAKPPSDLRGLMFGVIGTLIVIGAAGGGYFYAQYQSQPTSTATALPAVMAGQYPALATLPAEPRTDTPVVAVTPPAAATDGQVESSAAAIVAAVPKVKSKMSAREETDMLTRAGQLLDQGDVVSARIVLDYAVSEGGVNAAYRLAQTYDPKTIAELNIALEVTPDVTQALTLYYFAARSGHADAAKRIAEIKKARESR